MPERVYAPEHTCRSRTPAAPGLRLSRSDPAMYALASLDVLPRVTPCVASNAPFPGLDGLPGPGFGHGVAIPRTVGRPPVQGRTRPWKASRGARGFRSERDRPGRVPGMKLPPFGQRGGLGGEKNARE